MRQTAVALQSGQRDDEGGNAEPVDCDAVHRPDREPEPTSGDGGERDPQCRESAHREGTPVKPATEPTERSIPAVMMVKSSP